MKDITSVMSVLTNSCAMAGLRNKWRTMKNIVMENIKQIHFTFLGMVNSSAELSFLFFFFFFKSISSNHDDSML